MIVYQYIIFFTHSSVKANVAYFGFYSFLVQEYTNIINKVGLNRLHILLRLAASGQSIEGLLQEVHLVLVDEESTGISTN